MAILYPYRDAIEGIEEIISENKQEDEEIKRKLALACRDYLSWSGYHLSEEEDEDEDEEE